MELRNTHTLHHIDFLDIRPVPYKQQSFKSLWWGLILIETLLLARLTMEYFGIQTTGTFTSIIYSITQPIIHPFSLALHTVSGDSSHVWVPVLVAINGYFLLAITIVRILKNRRSPRARIERARELSRRRYSY